MGTVLIYAELDIYGQTSANPFLALSSGQPSLRVYLSESEVILHANTGLIVI
ncbi:hypothetical protein CROQUDRAFT_98338 [Cronartium quercuum f. sp. fusiforme G11]|uniref:Uncharacterized protein n=1 Tax=Cronartium quercuum f. sp. fusiforme G11 TaxID=708437 RepID=A0A9P6T7P2_9BASI|nr:hypothetical protein CROQUDRAFT_98338 [Cronartium quercuum f. sp. fusiforme G11]